MVKREVVNREEGLQQSDVVIIPLTIYRSLIIPSAPPSTQSETPQHLCCGHPSTLTHCLACILAVEVAKHCLLTGKKVVIEIKIPRAPEFHAGLAVKAFRTHCRKKCLMASTSGGFSSLDFTNLPAELRDDLLLIVMRVAQILTLWADAEGPHFANTEGAVRVVFFEELVALLKTQKQLGEISALRTARAFAENEILGSSKKLSLADKKQQAGITTKVVAIGPGSSGAQPIEIDGRLSSSSCSRCCSSSARSFAARTSCSRTI